uniref:Immunoglobulin V-set domain-containing protein n=1 Tax=Amphiprion percula TaxID=161767 RepID=A0A3P8SPJ9_AMPPE
MSFICLLEINGKSVFCHFCLHLGVNCQQLTAVKDEESSLEGSTVTLTYTYSKTAAYDDYFFWYQQHPGKPPEFLVSHTVAQNVTTAGLSATVSDDKKQISMKISSAAVSDSAVYYSSWTM